MAIDVNNFVSMVVGSSGGARIRRHFGIDVKKYEWVKDFIRDRDIREQIRSLKEEIVTRRSLPINKKELQEMLQAQIEAINKARIAQMTAHLKAVQQREVPLFNALTIGARSVSGFSLLPYMINFTQADIDLIFKELPEGMSQKEIEKTVEQHQNKIKDLEAVIAKELSPKSRWFYRDNGNPIPYPQGCRWTPFVAVWEKVASRFSGPVNMEGWEMRDSDEIMAYHLLKLNSVRRVTPLREPIRNEY